MQTTLDCLPCFLRQTLRAARLSTPDPTVQQAIMAKTAARLAGLDFSLSPPENAVTIYAMISEISGCADPFAGLKKTGNKIALQLASQAGQAIRQAADPLLAAIKFAAAGNIIDYGSQQRFDAHRTISSCLDQDFMVDDYPLLTEALKPLTPGGTVLYLGDNCGELIFDGLLIELLAGMGIQIILAVKDRPIINDALVADALDCGLDKHCRVISNGTGCPGTPLNDCSPEFQEIFSTADLIISKGQGNFETLSETPGPIWFLLTVKCPVTGNHLAEQAGLKTPLPGNGELVLLQNRNA